MECNIRVTNLNSKISPEYFVTISDDRQDGGIDNDDNDIHNVTVMVIMMVMIMLTLIPI